MSLKEQKYLKILLDVSLMHGVFSEQRDDTKCFIPPEVFGAKYTWEKETASKHVCQWHCILMRLLPAGKK